MTEEKDQRVKDEDDNHLNQSIQKLESEGNIPDHDDDHGDDDNSDDEHAIDKTDYTAFSKEDFIVKAESLIHHHNIKEANDAYKKMRLLFDDLIKTEREALLKQFVAEGNEPRDFRPPVDELKNKFYQAYTRFLERRAEEKKLAEVEKAKNLNEKKAILQKIKDLVESDENEKSLEQLKELQRHWKQIRRVPREQMSDLWESYRFYLESFYDKLSIFNELKDLDRQKNLEAKIELIKKVDELLIEKSIKKAHILLNKYHEDFKNTGPVPRDFTEDIWNRFKEASDKVIERNKVKIEELKEQRKQNLEIKTLLCEKAEQIGQIPYKTPKDWNEKTKELELLFEQWKAIGHVPEAESDKIWKRFREAQNVFYQQRKEFYNKLNESKDDNLKNKIALCEEAEKLSSSNDFDKTTLAFIQLQDKWKTIGPVSEKHSKDVWDRFRKACDEFFNRREIHNKARKESETENLTKKEALLKSLNNLLELDKKEKDNAFKSFRDIQKQWSHIGHVPANKFHQLNKKYDKVIELISAHLGFSSEEFKQSRFKDHIASIATRSNGSFLIKDEENKIFNRIKVLRSELETFENNLGFFANSKGANKLKDQFEDKIKKTEEIIAKLESDLKTIKEIRRSNAS
jgi:hypothetical protein